jgi:hypothetical protein
LPPGDPHALHVAEDPEARLDGGVVVEAKALSVHLEAGSAGGIPDPVRVQTVLPGHRHAPAPFLEAVRG